ncbi:MAG: fused MFS/spermidine synthase [Planctomycetes bacterium]|nr:fused MFS/spermidine synthase [Planctomycetota bacterium]
MRLVYLATLLSGFAALVYQVLWIRQLTLVLGSTTASMATVVAAFMGGLAFGSARLGPAADRSPRPLRLYAGLELGIALGALLTLGLLAGLERLYPRLALLLGDATLGVARVALTFAVLLVPTALMGGTFPVLVRGTSRTLERLGSTVGRLYAVNTLGAVLGCFVTGLYLIGELGLHGGYAVAVGFNLLSGAAALAAARRVDPGPQPGASPAAEPSASTSLPARFGLMATAAAVSGCFALSYEIVWGRAFAIVLGHSSYASTFVLGTYLAGLALGGALVARRLDRLADPGRTFAHGQLVLTALCGLSFALLPLVPFREYELGTAPLAYVAQNLLSTSLLLLPPTVLLGALLPLAVKAATRSLARSGHDAGLVYAWNTVGAIGGSLLAGFVLVPRLGTQRALLLVVAGNALLALAVGLRLRWPGPASVLAVGLALGAALLLPASAGSPLLRAKATARVERAVRQPVELLHFEEDLVTAVGLFREPSGLRRLCTDGVPMTHWGIETIWMTHLPLAIAPEAKHALVLCLGMGNTYRAALDRGLRATAVELSPGVARAFAMLHGDISGSAGRGRILVGDARHAVSVGAERYDLITIDPPPPLHSAGTVNFHTREFYEACRGRLAPQGVLCMWLPFFDCTVAEYRMLVQTFRAVFPEAQAWWSLGAHGAVSGLYLLARADGGAIAAEPVRAALRSDAVRADARRFVPGLAEDSFELLLPMVALAGPALDLFCGDAPVMSDATPWLEYPLFRTAGDARAMDGQALLQLVQPGRR